MTYGGCAGGGGVETLYRRGDVIERGGGGGGRGGGGSRGRGDRLHGAVGYQAAGALWERQMGDDRDREGSRVRDTELHKQTDDGRYIIDQQQLSYMEDSF